MATASLPPSSPPEQAYPADGMIAVRIESVRAALWRSELTRSLLMLVLFLIGVLLGWAVVDQWIWSGGPLFRLAACAVTLGLLIVWSIKRVVPLFTSQIDVGYAAQSIERDIPEMKHALSSYVALRDQRDAAGLRGVVVRSIGSRAAGRLNQHADDIPSEITGCFQLWIWVAAAFAVLAAYTVFSPKDTIHSTSRLLLPLASIEPPTRVRILEVTPGDTEILAGKTVDVTAQIAGVNDSDNPHVVWEIEGERREIALRVDPQRGEPFFQASLGGSQGVEDPSHYTVVAGDARSERFRIITSDVPVIQVDSVHYQPPVYTKRPERTTRAAAIEGLEGTTITLRASTNRAVAEAQIELNPRTTGGQTTATAGVFPMQFDAEGRLTAQLVLRIGADRPGVVPYSSYRLRVTDAAGAKNPEPVVYPIRILADLAPEVTIATPVRNPKEVPVDAQQLIEVHALDPDFGLTRVALRLQRGSQRLDDVVLWQDAASEGRNQIVLYRLRPQALGLRPGDVLQVRAVAADNRMHPTRQKPAPNVTVSDPIELRIVKPAHLNESRPSEDGLSATDNQPAVDPDNSGASDDSQPNEEGDASQSSAGGSGGSGESGNESDQGEAAEEGGSASGGEAAGGEPSSEQSSSEQSSDGGSAGNEGGGDQAGSSGGANSDAAGSGSQSPDEATSEAGSGGNNEASPSADRSGKPGKKGSEGNGAGGSDMSNTERPPTDGAASPAGSANDEPQGTGGSSTPGEKNADMPANGSEGQGNQSGPAGEQGNTGKSSDGSGSSSQSPSAPQHPGEAFERIKEYLDEKQKQQEEATSGDPSSDPQNSNTSDGSQQKGGRNTDMDGGADQQDAGSPPSSTPESRGDQTSGSKESTPANGAANGENEAGDKRSPETGTGDASRNQSEGDDSTTPSNEATTGDEANNAASDSSSNSADSAAGSESRPAEESDQSGQGTEDAGSDSSAAASQQEGSDDASETPGVSENSSTATDSNGSKTGASGEEGESDSGSSDNASASDGRESGGAKNAAQDGAPSESSPTTSPQTDAGNERTADGTGAERPESAPPSDASPAAEAGNEREGGVPPSDSDAETTGRTGSGINEAASDEFIDRNEAPEPVDVDYAKEATDMVLDYLKETRDRPDPELLERLNWSEQDLEQFLQRWESARPIQPGEGGAGSQEFEETLRSLGIRNRSTAGDGAAREEADRLPGLRDSGTRRPAPTLYRDAFEAFRRSVAQ